MVITPDVLLEAIPGITQENAETYALYLDFAMEQYEINTPERRARFLAQLRHESGNFNTIKENLNYSAQRLTRVFGKYFGPRSGRDPYDYARQPEKIANVVYANRMGNGDEESGDGWKYRGRGLIQITGKNNYTAYSEYSGVDVVDDPDLLLQPEHAVGSRCWFWATNGLNALADQNTEDAFIRITRRINGGTNGYDDRYAKWVSAKDTLGA